MKKLINYTFYFVIGTLFIASVILFILRISDSSALSKAKVQIFEILTGSMEPTLKGRSEDSKSKGDIVICVKVDIDSLEEGDIVAYYYDIDKDGTYEVVVHRLVEISDNSYRIVGDNEGSMEETLTYNELQNRFVGKILFNRKSYIITFLYKIITNVFGFIFIIAVPLLYLIVKEIVVLIKTIKNNQEVDNQNSVKYNGVVYKEEEILKMIEEKDEEKK
ncbi:MAG: S26 family signal peptidase [Gammaproteobacteria bacterium]|nr:S26 family signal peptidase [Gammaproteobacteria bacterium]